MSEIKERIKNNRSSSLRDAPGWVLIAALIYAPWDYGAVTQKAIIRLNWLLGIALALWCVSVALRFIRRDRPTFSLPKTQIVVFVGTAAAILVLGWWMTANAARLYDSEQHMFVRIANVWSGGPGSVDQAVSAATMMRVSLLLAVVAMTAEFSRSPVWLMRFWTTAAAVGGSLALLGLLQKATGASMIFWQSVERPVKTFFATFFYHGNAGAFLNLTLPLTCGLALRAFRRKHTNAARALWLSLALVSLVAVLANTSRASQALGVTLFFCLLFGVFLQRWRAAGYGRGTHTAIVTAVVVLAAVAVIQASRMDQSIARWENINETVSHDARWSAMQVAIRALPEAGWLGFGPGTFHIMFPYLTGSLGENVRGFWLFLHQDYLQTLLEWGWLGAILWAVVFFGGMAIGLANRVAERESKSWMPRQRLFLTCVLLGLGATVLHALVDFPLQIASIQLYVAVYLGICWGSASWKTRPGN